MNVIRKRSLNRRRFLGESGVMLSLPVLDAMIPALTPLAHAQAAATQWNFIYFYFPFGHKPLGDESQGERSTPHRSFSLEQNLSALRPVYDQKRFTIMLDIHHAGNEHSAASTLTAHPATSNDSGCVRDLSFDEYLANSLPGAAQRRFRNFTLGVRDNGSRNDQRRHYLSWRRPGQFNNKEMNEVNLYDQLFSQMTPVNQNASARHLLLSKKSAIDAVLADVTRLRASLGVEDQSRLDQYLESVRSVERRIAQSLDGTPATRTFQYPRPQATNPDTLDRMEQKTKVMIDLAMIGFASGQNQIATVMLDNAGQGLGVFADYNKSYHDAGRDDGSMHGWIDRYSRDHIHRVHRMLARCYLNGINRMVEHGIFDHTVFLMTSEAGFHHVPRGSIVLAAGGMFGTLNGTSRSMNQEVGRLYAGIGNKMGLPMSRFGRPDGVMTW